MQKFYTLLTLAITLFFTACSSTPVSRHGALSVNGTALVDCHGDTVVLHGVSFGWHCLWPRFYNAGAVHTLATEWNVDIVRAALGIELATDSAQTIPPYITEPEKGIACITAVVDAAIKEGIYVIIDWHSHNINLSEAKEFFALMATKYRGVPNVLYEVFNEPDYETWEEVKAYSEEVIAVIRAIEPSAVILVGSPKWDQDLTGPALDPISGYSNLMYTLHFYAASHHAELREMGDYAINNGLPLFISECAAMLNTGDGPLDYEDFALWQQWMDSHSLSRIYWSLSDKDETCSMLLPPASDQGPWPTSVMKEWGTTVKAQLTAPLM